MFGDQSRGGTVLMLKHVTLLALPGTELNELRNNLQTHGFEVSEDAASPALLVIDVRGIWTEQVSQSPVADYLDKRLLQSDAVVFMQLAAAELSTQMAWQNWLKQRIAVLDCEKRPILRALQTDLNASSLQALAQLPILVKSGGQSIPVTHQTLNFAIQKVQLEHFLMSLDGLSHAALGQVWQISGCFWTAEYAHPVAFNWTPLRVEMAATTEAVRPLICVVCESNTPALTDFMSQIIQACEAT